jgi:hypothetical protein
MDNVDKSRHGADHSETKEPEAVNTPKRTYMCTADGQELIGEEQIMPSVPDRRGVYWERKRKANLAGTIALRN